MVLMLALKDLRFREAKGFWQGHSTYSAMVECNLGLFYLETVASSLPQSQDPTVSGRAYTLY